VRDLVKQWPFWMLRFSGEGHWSLLRPGKHAGLKTVLELLQGEAVVYIYCDSIWP
jgi:hypothetical protein